MWYFLAIRALSTSVLVGLLATRLVRYQLNSERRPRLLAFSNMNQSVHFVFSLEFVGGQGWRPFLAAIPPLPATAQCVQQLLGVAADGRAFVPVSAVSPTFDDARAAALGWAEAVYGIGLMGHAWQDYFSDVTYDAGLRFSCPGRRGSRDTHQISVADES